MVDSFAIAESGLTAADTWMATTANNVANAMTPGYQAEEPVFAAAGVEGGVSVAGIATSNEPAVPLAPSTTNPLGTPGSNVDMTVEIPTMLLASGMYQANLAVLQTAQSTYQDIVALTSPDEIRTEGVMT